MFHCAILLNIARVRQQYAQQISTQAVTPLVTPRQEYAIQLRIVLAPVLYVRLTLLPTPQFCVVQQTELVILQSIATE
jgi:hypothetical protein